MGSSSNEHGKKGEDLAEKLLRSKGYEIVERNYHFRKYGEVDIIAKDKEADSLVFVEVKSRKSLFYGDPIYAVTTNKVKQVKKVASGYLFEKEITGINIRFDVVTVVLPEKGEPDINHYINAFDY
ncbi:MAG TPA: YraN family protein [Ignavibacteriaceae bacterium]|nr:YraN family protein [Ignavibacteriaceae bacterium]